MSHDDEKSCLDDRIMVDTSNPRAAPWSSTGWKAKASGGAWTGQRPFWRCARLRKATIMISVPTGGSMPARYAFASTRASRNIDPLHH